MVENDKDGLMKKGVTLSGDGEVVYYSGMGYEIKAIEEELPRGKQGNEVRLGQGAEVRAEPNDEL